MQHEEEEEEEVEMMGVVKEFEHLSPEARDACNPHD